jgi:hypothetical protein
MSFCLYTTASQCSARRRLPEEAFQFGGDSFQFSLFGLESLTIYNTNCGKECKICPAGKHTGDDGEAECSGEHSTARLTRTSVLHTHMYLNPLTPPPPLLNTH